MNAHTYSVRRCTETDSLGLPLYQLVRDDGRILVHQETMTVCDGVLSALQGYGHPCSELVEVADSIKRGERREFIEQRYEALGILPGGCVQS